MIDLSKVPNAIQIVMVIICFLAAFKLILDIINWFKRNPTVDRELQQYMPRKEIEGHFKQLKEDDAQLWKRINAMDRTNRENQEDIQRALGRIEGHLEGSK